MAARHPFVLSDGAVVTVAVSAVAGAWVGGGPGRLAGIAVLAAALLLRRPALVCAGVAVLAAGLADAALAGLHPVARAPVEGWATLVTDPAPLDSGGVRVDVRLDGRRLEATAFGAARGALTDLLAGERVEVSGTVRPPPADAPWLVPRRVVGRLSIDEVGAVAHGSAASRAANGLRRTLADGAAGLPRTARSLLAGVVLGDDREQAPEVTDDFRAAGLSHLLAVSGQNVAFMLAVAGPVLTRLRWRARVPVTLVLLGAFALLVRFEPSVLRAGAMAAVATLAAALGRPSAGIRILGLAVTALVLVDPLLVRSVGFGLSVGAAAAILLLAPRITVALPGPRLLAEPFGITLAAQVGTMPLLVSTFGGLPVASVPANLLAGPAPGPLMIWGLTAGVVAGVVPAPLAAVLHLPTSVLAWWLAAAARWGAALPLGELRAPHASALAAAAVVWVVLRRRAPSVAGRLLVAAVAAIVVVAALGRPVLPGGSSPVGDAATVWSAGGALVLAVDGPGGTERTLEALRRAGARCVDVVAVSGSGRAAATLAAALHRRCGAVVMAVEGRAHPGWVSLPPGSSVAVGGLAVAATADGDLAVHLAARAPP